MVGTKVRLKVVKADGSVEEYLHTKVIGAISNALAYDGQADIHVAEELAEVVTYFLYHGKTPRTVTSGEILSIIKAVLTATTYEDAAIVLTEHHFNRKLKRSRIEVVSIDIQQLADAEMLCGTQQSSPRSRWDKSKIVDDLVTNYDVSRQTARTIASMVEEKIFNIGLTSVSASLIKQLVLGDTAAFLRAQRQLQTV
jgi:transcriptional regulator NrdR family protein